MLKDIQTILKNRKLKSTPIRVEILALFKKTNNAISINYINALLPKFDRVTRYRTIMSFLEKGIIHQAHVQEHDTFYALCGSGCAQNKHSHQHAHFVCQTCHEVSCQPMLEAPQISLPNFKIAQTDITLSGICSKCV